MLTDKSVLFLDEPTTGLDAASALQMVKILKSLAEHGKTVVVIHTECVTHRAEGRSHTHRA